MVLVLLGRMRHNGGSTHRDPSPLSRPLGKAFLDKTEVKVSAQGSLARGVLFVHSCPPAVRPHVEWAVASVLGVPVRLEWHDQPMAPGCVRSQTGWRGPAGTAGRLAASLRGWPLVRAEITEEPSEGCDGERYSMTPDLGVYRVTMSANGDVLVQEDRMRAAMNESADLPSMRHALDRLLGTAWDDELELYRRAGDGTPVRWLSSAV
jgi:hypothetical protein